MMGIKNRLSKRDAADTAGASRGDTPTVRTVPRAGKRAGRALLAAGAAGLVAVSSPALASATPTPPAPSLDKDVVRISTGAPNQTVLGNLTVTRPSAPGWATAYPCDQPRPLASNINYSADKTVANFTAVRTDANGDFCVYTLTGTHVLFDQVAETDAVSASAPVRKLDTRKSDEPKPAEGSVTKVHTGGAAYQTVLGNLTVTQPSAPGWATAYPCDQPRPLASNINYGADQTVANFAAVRTDAAGDFCIYTLSPTHLVFDQSAAGDEPATSAPVRKLDTRQSGTSERAPVGSVTVVETDAPDQTVFGNLTVTRPIGGGFVAAYPCDQARPNASNVNFADGQTVANFAAVRTDAKGRFCLYTTNATHLVFDQVGATSKVASHPAVRKIDTRVSGVRTTNEFSISGTWDDWVTGGMPSFLPNPSTFNVYPHDAYGHALQAHFSDETTGEWFGIVISGPNWKPLVEGATYTSVQRFSDATHAGMDVWGNGRGCNDTSGEFTVRQLVRDSYGSVVRLAVDFTQHCDAGESSASGRLLYNSSLAGRYPGPQMTAGN